MKKVLIAVIGYLIVQSAAYGAPAAPFQVLEPAPIVVRGVFDGSASEWSALIRVQAGSQPVEAIQVLPSDLIAVNDPATRVARSNVALHNADALAANEIRDLRLVVSNLPQAGTYTGTIQLIARGAPITAALSLPLRVDLPAREIITPIDPVQTLQITSCIISWFCSDAQTWNAYLDQQGPAMTAITTATIVLHGQHTGTSVAPSVIQAALPLNLKTNSATPLQLGIQRFHLPADQYTGRLQVQTRTGTTVAPIAFTLNVKHSVFWALLAIAAGIVCGRFVRFMQSPDVQRGLMLSGEIEPVRALAEAFRARSFYPVFAERLASLEQRIDDPNEDSEALRREIKEWHSRAIILHDLQRLGEKMQDLRLEKDESTRAFTRSLDDAQKTVITGTLDEAKTARATVYADYQRLLVAQPQAKSLDLSPAEPSPLPAIPQARSAPTGLRGWLERQQSALNWLSGIVSPASAKARYRFYRPLAGAVFLLVLIAIGLQAKYASAPTFGAQWTDYWDIFLWGLTADVVNRAVIGQLSSDQPA